MVAMKTLLIVFHSLTGGTRQMAEAAARAAQTQSEVNVGLLPAVQAQPEDVFAANGYMFATPETLAPISGLMKDFFDRTYYPALERINGRPYAILICAGTARTQRVRLSGLRQGGGCGLWLSRSSSVPTPRPRRRSLRPR
jgi:multimeric flavodoxin WrbA